jgi:hypothetical protein
MHIHCGRAPQHPRELELGSTSQDQYIWVQTTRVDPFFISNRFEPNTCKIFFHDSMRVPHYFIGLVVGLLVFISTMVTATKGYAGVGMNPARCLGPALVRGGHPWKGHWVFWVGSVVASVAFSLYTKIIPREHLLGAESK